MNISRAFYDWVRECHENHDRQVMLGEMKIFKKSLVPQASCSQSLLVQSSFAGLPTSLFRT